MSSEDNFTVMSWNVDGYFRNEKIHNAVLAFVEKYQPDVFFITETKCKEQRLILALSGIPKYCAAVNVHDPTCNHGVAALIKKNKKLTSSVPFLDIPSRRDSRGTAPAKGRVIHIESTKIHMVATYNPNSGTRELKNLDYRTKIWDPCVWSWLNEIKKEKPAIFFGDLNVALGPLDVSDEKKMARYAGYTDEERKSFKDFLESGWVDIWREKNPLKREYTWISRKPREGYGMRLDNVLVSAELASKVKESKILTDYDITISDHVPIMAIIN